MNKNKYHIEIEIDKLTNSIENAISGDSFPFLFKRLRIQILSILQRLRVGCLIGKQNRNVMIEKFIN